MKKLIRKIIAHFHLNPKIVCEESEKLGKADYHDYIDSHERIPIYMHEYNCVRCGKEFII